MKSIEEFLQGTEDFVDYLELSFKYNINEITDAIGESEIATVIKSTQHLDDKDKSIIWAALDKALNSEKPKIKYDGLLRDEEHEDLNHVYVANLYDVLEYKNKVLPVFMEEFKNISKSPVVKGVFYLINETMKEREYLIRAGKVDSDGEDLDGDICELRREMIDGESDNGFYTYFTDIVNEVFPNGYDSKVANSIFNKLKQDDENYNEDKDDVYFVNTIKEHENIDMTFVIREQLKDFFEYALK